MTKKPIIIDDVDVSECEFAVKPINDNEIICHCVKGFLLITKMHEQPESVRSGLCENNPNCYYKLYKRKEQECERLKNDKFALEVHIDSLTSPVNVEDCEHSVYNGEYIACRYYEGQRCDDTDFANCMFRENVRLKQQLDQLKAEKEELREKIKAYDEVYSNHDVLNERNNYKQSLQEIKEVIKQEGYINKKTQIFKGSVLYQAMEDLKLPDRKILKIINEVLNV